MNKEIMEKAGFKKEVDLVEQGLCPFCGRLVNENSFKDELSRKKFRI